MIQESSTYFPFDGTCKCSRDGDVTLKFNNGSSLKTHFDLLSMASSVFGSKLTDCTKTKELELKNTSRETWVHILNHLHPAAALVFVPFNPVDNIVQLTDLLEQAKKFSLTSLFTLVDEAMSMNFPKELDYNTQRTSGVNNSKHVRLCNTVLRFKGKLPRTSTKVRENIVQYLKSSANANRTCNYSGRSYGHNQHSSAQQNQTHQAQKQFAKDIIKRGSRAFYKKLIDDLIDNVL